MYLAKPVIGSEENNLFIMMRKIRSYLKDAPEFPFFFFFYLITNGAP